MQEVARYRRRGDACVEMGAAAIYAIAAYRGVDAVAVAVISDTVDERSWTLRSHDSIVFDRLRPTCDAAVAAAARGFSMPDAWEPPGESTFASVVGSMDRFSRRRSPLQRA